MGGVDDEEDQPEFLAGRSVVIQSTEGDELADNSDPREPELGDTEQVSDAPSVLSGVDPQHLHGLLGRDAEGEPLVKPIPLPEILTKDLGSDAWMKAMAESHRGFCFSSAFSASLPLDYERDDVRSPACVAKHETYPHDGLPPASVIIVFHNEEFYALLRSVHSVLNRTPPKLLKEVILVDDASAKDDVRFPAKHYDRLQHELSEYCKALPKVRLVRLKRRRGLMLARMEGAWRAEGDVVLFLDSHIEVTTGWVEPLLARILEDRSHVVVPSIDGIDYDLWDYKVDQGLGVLSFDWSLGQVLGRTGAGETQPMRSAVMAGGLFAGDRKQFLHLGGYDPEMRLYGGEEMEIGFRTWQCGGSIELIPCSHVGHVFRTSRYWQGQVYTVPGEEIARNKLRAAEVWMDEYVPLAKMKINIPKGTSLGDLERRRQLKTKLGCKPFKWYLDNVATDVAAPSNMKSVKLGSLANMRHGSCLDSFWHENVGEEIGVSACHGQGGSQSFMIDGDGHLILEHLDYAHCVSSLPDGQIAIGDCKFAKWEWDSAVGQLRQPDTNNCLSLVDDLRAQARSSLLLMDCRPGTHEQWWGWMT